MRLVIALLPGLILGLALAGCDKQKAAEPQAQANAAQAKAPAPAGGETYPTGVLDRSHAGTPAPAVTFEDPQGRPTNFAAFRGRPLLVNLWATWCGPCIVEMPSLDRLAERQNGLQVLALSQDMEGRDRVTQFFGARRLARLEPYLDPRLDVMMTLRIDTLPTTILYDAAGNEVWRMTGMAEWDGERAARLLAEGGVRP